MKVREKWKSLFDGKAEHDRNFTWAETYCALSLRILSDISHRRNKKENSKMMQSNSICFSFTLLFYFHNQRVYFTLIKVLMEDKGFNKKRTKNFNVSIETHKNKFIQNLFSLSQFSTFFDLWFNHCNWVEKRSLFNVTSSNWKAKTRLIFKIVSLQGR